MPIVSVVIPCFNHEKYIGECLDSVLNQTHSDFEVIVIDDGSTDGTPQIVRSYGSRVKYIWQKNKGPSSARNLGIRTSQAEFIAFQDADDIWLPEKLELQVEFLEENPDLAWVYSDMCTFNDQQILQTSWFSERPTQQGKVFEKLISNNFVPTITVIAKKSVILEVGGFDESLRSCEDKDLWLRLALKYPLGKLDRVLAKRRFHSNNLCRDNQLLFSSEIEVMQKMKRLVSSPSIQKRLESRLSKLYFELGYFFFARNNLTQAREFFRRSNLDRNLNFRTQLYFYSTFLDPRLIDWLRFFKNLGKTAASN